ncbi:diguanylate cyclase domain-containing protein [Dactylosporangium sp. CA-139066]|uniref:diguanylate cyclase domain-containing protein n=1 Tax=Dactylosporangium sp. CA-139066 TaxID=3239930 RepID=UPI003D8BF1DC
MSGPRSDRRAFSAYAAVCAVAAVAHPMLPHDWRPASFTLFSAGTLGPIALRLRRQPGAGRWPWLLLATAMTVLTAANGVIAVFGRGQKMTAEFGVTIGHGVLLAAALTLVVRRGRNDTGGLLDASVALMGIGTLLWIGLLQPHLEAVHSTVGARVALLVSVYVLTGVLGALGRLWVTAPRRFRSLELMIAALLLALAGNTTLAMTTGAMVVDRLPVVEVCFLVAYLCVGLAALHPDAAELTRPGPSPVDRISGGRLIFLGAAITLDPVAGGARQMFGLAADGVLIAVGTLALAPLVMLRIHGLARQREQAERALAHQAGHDELTGLPNRAELHRRLDAALAQEHEQEPDVVLLFCDLDGFKPINDRLGHAAGDELLVALAARLRAGLRAGETVARYGGDEFILLARAADRDAAVRRLTGHIRAALSEPFEVAGEPVTVGASIGAVASDGRTGADELIRRADEAMYRVKAAQGERGTARRAHHMPLTRARG